MCLQAFFFHLAPTTYDLQLPQVAFTQLIRPFLIILVFLQRKGLLGAGQKTILGSCCSPCASSVSSLFPRPVAFSFSLATLSFRASWAAF